MTKPIRHDTLADLLWALGALSYPEGELELDIPIEPASLPPLEAMEQILWEYETLGLSPGEHMLALYRDRLQARGVLSSEDLAGRRSGERVCVAGLVIVRQRPPTAKGHVFLTLEDETGLINLIVRPTVYERYRPTLRRAPLMLVEGQVQREGDAISLLVYRAARLAGG